MKSKIVHIILNEIRSNLKANVLFGTLIGLLYYYMISIFDPTMFGDLADMLANYPPEFMAMVGGLEMLELTEIGGYANVYLFEMAWLYFGIYLVYRVSQDLPSELENKSLDIYLSKPIFRWQYLIGKFGGNAFLLGVVVLINYGAFWIGIAVNPRIENYPVVKEINIAFLWLFMILFSLVATAFMISVILPQRKAMTVALVVLIATYFLGTFDLGEGLENGKYLSLFTYYETGRILILHSMENVWRDLAILFVYIIGMLILAIIIYEKRDLPV